MEKNPFETMALDPSRLYKVNSMLAPGGLRSADRGPGMERLFGPKSLHKKYRRTLASNLAFNQNVSDSKQKMLKLVNRES
jgi:hypothetical protein